MVEAQWIDPLLLKTLVAVAETGSFVGAAERIGRTQSAVSMQMKRLEELVGSPALFIRTARKMSLTNRAEILALHARRVLRAHEELVDALNDAAVPEVIRLGSPEDYVEALLPKALDRFSARWPGVEVDLVCDTSEALHRRVDERQVDLAIVTAGRDTPVDAALRDEPLVWVASPDFLREKRSPLPLALFQPGCTSRTLAIKACDSAGIAHRVAFSSPSLAGLLPLLRQGLAVAALARCSVPKELKILSAEDGMPELPSLTISMLESRATGPRPLVDSLAGKIKMSLLS